MKPWNKGLTKMTDARVWELSRKLSHKKRLKEPRDERMLKFSKEHVLSKKTELPVNIIEVEKPYNIDLDEIKKYFDSISIRDNGIIFIREKDYKNFIKKIEFVIRDIKCPICNTTDIRVMEKSGLRKTGYGRSPRYLCKKCNKRFTMGGRYIRMRNTPQIIIASQKLYSNYYSTRVIKDIIKILYGVNISNTAVSRYGRKDMGRRGKNGIHGTG